MAWAALTAQKYCGRRGNDGERLSAEGKDACSFKVGDTEEDTQNVAGHRGRFTREGVYGDAFER